MVGYATTARAMASAPRDAAHPGVEDAAYWRYVASLPGPKVAVVQDLDSTPVGSIWGEVNASRHRALGCVGMLTHGAVRDIDEVTRLGFFAYAHCLVVSHAFAHWVDYGLPVVVAGLTIRSGDLLHGDKHGVLLIPPEIPLGDLIRIAREVDRLEREIIGYSLSPLPTVEGVIRVSESVTARWPSWGGASPGLDVMF
jgi:regulator of RNase E activity RraA